MPSDPSPGYEAAEAMTWLQDNTPEDWCWQFGYHPATGMRGRGPGTRRITLMLLLPQVMENGFGRSPQFHEEMDAKPGASYLVLAKRAKDRAMPPADAIQIVNQPGIGYGIHGTPVAGPKCPKCGAPAGVRCRMPSCGALK